MTKSWTRVPSERFSALADVIQMPKLIPVADALSQAIAPGYVGETGDRSLNATNWGSLAYRCLEATLEQTRRFHTLGP